MEQVNIFYKSDFKIFLGSSDNWTVPFKIRFWTDKSGCARENVASFDGVNYRNCRLMNDGRLMVAFDNHKMGRGKLMMEVHLFLNDEDYRTGVCDQVIAPQAVVCHVDETVTEDLSEPASESVGAGNYVTGHAIDMVPGDVIRVTAEYQSLVWEASNIGTHPLAAKTRGTAVYVCDHDVRVMPGYSGPNAGEMLHIEKVSVKAVEATIELGLTGDKTIEAECELPPFYQKGDPGLTPEEHDALVSATEDAKSAARSANMASGLATGAAENANTAAQGAERAASGAREAGNEAITAAQGASSAAGVANAAAKRAEDSVLELGLLKQKIEKIEENGANVVNVADYITGGEKHGESMPSDADVYVFKYVTFRPAHWEDDEEHPVEGKAINYIPDHRVVDSRLVFKVQQDKETTLGLAYYTFATFDGGAWALDGEFDGYDAPEWVKAAFGDDLHEKVANVELEVGQVKEALDGKVDTRVETVYENESTGFYRKEVYSAQVADDIAMMTGHRELTKEYGNYDRSALSAGSYFSAMSAESVRSSHLEKKTDLRVTPDGATINGKAIATTDQIPDTSKFVKSENDTEVSISTGTADNGSGIGLDEANLVLGVNGEDFANEVRLDNYGLSILLSDGKKAKYNDKEIATTDQIPDTSQLATKEEVTELGSEVGKVTKNIVILDGTKPFAEQVTDANTIYDVRDVFDLGGDTATIPTGCTLKFNGGKLSNGTLEGQNTSVEVVGVCEVFDGVSFVGTWKGYISDLFFAYNDNKSHYSIISSIMLFEVVDIFRQEYWLERWKKINLNTNGARVNGRGVTLYVTSSKGTTKQNPDGSIVYVENSLFNLSGEKTYYFTDFHIEDNGDDLPNGWGENLDLGTRYDYFSSGLCNFIADKLTTNGRGEAFHCWSTRHNAKRVEFKNCDFRTPEFAIEIGVRANDLSLDDVLFENCRFTKTRNGKWCGLFSFVCDETTTARIGKICFMNCYVDSSLFDGNIESTGNIGSLEVYNSTFVNHFFDANSTEISYDSVIVFGSKFLFNTKTNNVQYQCKSRIAEFKNNTFILHKGCSNLVLNQGSGREYLCMINNTIEILNDGVLTGNRYPFNIKQNNGCRIVFIDNVLHIEKNAFNAGDFSSRVVLPWVYDVAKGLEKLTNDYSFTNAPQLTDIKSANKVVGYIKRLQPIGKIQGVTLDENGYLSSGEEITIPNSISLADYGDTITFRIVGKWSKNESWINQKRPIFTINLGSGSVALCYGGWSSTRLYYTDENGNESAIGTAGVNDIHLLNESLAGVVDASGLDDLEITISKYYGKLRVIARAHDVPLFWSEYEYSSTLSLASYKFSPNEQLKIKSFGFALGGIVGI